MTNFKNDGAERATMIIRHIPRHLRDHFKAWCAKRGKSMKEAFVAFMRDCVRKG